MPGYQNSWLKNFQILNIQQYDCIDIITGNFNLIKLHFNHMESPDARSWVFMEALMLEY